MNVYAYKNRFGDFWYLPFYQEDAPETIKKKIVRMILMDPQKFKENHLDETDLYHLGEFDDDTGKFKLLDEPRFLVDCRSEFTRLSEALKHGD